MNILAINFHYVRPDSETDDPLHARTPKEFESQLDQLEKLAFSMSPGEMELVLGDPMYNPPNKDSFVLTFDDGLKDHYEYVAPELAKRNIKAFFFINTLPWQGQYASIHLFQLLRCHMSTIQICDEINQAAERVRLKNFDIQAIPKDRVRQRYIYDDIETARMKYAINVILEPNIRASILQKIAEKHMPSHRNILENLYMTENEVNDLHEAGHTIGCHSHRHESFESLTDHNLNKDIKSNKKNIEKVIGVTPTWFSYPSGTTDAVDERVACALKHHGFKYAWTMNRGFTNNKHDNLRLNRIDTNDAPGGKAPKFSWKTPHV